LIFVKTTLRARSKVTPVVDRKKGRYLTMENPQKFMITAIDECGVRLVVETGNHSVAMNLMEAWKQCGFAEIRLLDVPVFADRATLDALEAENRRREVSAGYRRVSAG
jgi:hypothetical protein